MRKLVFILLLIFPMAIFAGNNSYRAWLLSQAGLVRISSRVPDGKLAPLPKYQTPRGALFCRMEDKVTRVTKIWLKLGVE